VIIPNERLNISANVVSVEAEHKVLYMYEFSRTLIFLSWSAHLANLSPRCLRDI
jgi:hypothetical protein